MANFSIPLVFLILYIIATTIAYNMNDNQNQLITSKSFSSNQLKATDTIRAKHSEARWQD